MSKIFGFAVGAVWVVFTVFAMRYSAAGWSTGYPDQGFWWGVVAALLAIASTVAFAGTARFRPQGPKK
jgi:hypothetical protein